MQAWINTLKNLLRQKQQDKSKPNKQPKPSTNPYLNSKILWNDLYGSVEDKLKKSNLIIFILSGVLVLMVFGMISIASQSRVKPYLAVIHGNDFVRVNSVPLAEYPAVQAKLAAMLSAKFIQDIRGVSLDPFVNQSNYVTAVSMSAQAATATAKKMFQVNQIKHQFVVVKITSFILQSQHAAEIRWLEVTHDSNTGDVMSQQHFTADLTFDFDKTSNDSVIAAHNPLGFYLTSIAWSEDA